jgi:hypothetical protein
MVFVNPMSDLFQKEIPKTFRPPGRLLDVDDRQGRS